ncbi:MAG: hypothetical protein ACRDJW_11415 [Thermomicrobiales bacterium]
MGHDPPPPRRTHRPRRPRHRGPRPGRLPGRLPRRPPDLCPTSNVCIGVVPAARDHPFRRLDDAGILVILTDEYRLLAREFNYTTADLERITLNAVRASFLPDDEKARLAAEIATGCAALRERSMVE